MRALEWATRSVALAPSDFAALDTLAYVQFRNGQIAPALAAAERAIAANPECGPCRGRYGDFLEAAGRIPEARAQWTRALALLETQEEEPEFPRARWVEKLAATASGAAPPTATQPATQPDAR